MHDMWLWCKCNGEMPIIQGTKRSREEQERCKCSRFPSSSVSNEIACCNEEELKNTVIPKKKKKCQQYTMVQIGFSGVKKSQSYL